MVVIVDAAFRQVHPKGLLLRYFSLVRAALIPERFRLVTAFKCDLNVAEVLLAVASLDLKL